MENEKNEKHAIDLSNILARFIKSFFKLWPLVIVFALIGAGVFFFRAWRSFSPVYEARARFSVTSGMTEDDIFHSSSYYDNAAAEQLAQTFPQLISTEIMRDLMLQELGTTYINGTVSAQAVAQTNMFVLTVRSPSASDAYSILNAVIDCYPQVAVYMVDNPRLVIREAPSLPTEPANSFSWKSPAAKGAIYGAAAALVLIAAVACFSKTVNTASELREVVNLPLLATLPRVYKKKRREGKHARHFSLQDQNYDESIRGLRIKMKRGLAKNEKVVMVTSTLSGEGKTTVAVNLALSLTRDGHRVVLVDADLRKQDIADIFGADEGGLGMIDALKNPAISPLDCIREVPDSTLRYISADFTDDSHIDYDHKTVVNFFTVLRNNFDYVIVDTPPNAVVSDTGVLCRYAEGIIYVVKQDYARRAAILDSIDSLSSKKAVIIGCVLNGVIRSGGQYSYGYGYGYKYGYGYRSRYGYGKKKYGYGYTSKSTKKENVPSHAPIEPHEFPGEFKEPNE